MARGVRWTLLGCFAPIVLCVPGCAARSQPERQTASLCDELTFHRYVRPSDKAWTERPTPKVDYVDEVVAFRLTPSMVESALISGMTTTVAPEDRERAQLPEWTFPVDFMLNAAGRERAEAFHNEPHVEYVVRCNDHLFFAVPPFGPARYVGVFVDDSSELAEQLARSLTPHVEFLRANHHTETNPFLFDQRSSDGSLQPTRDAVPNGSPAPAR